MRTRLGAALIAATALGCTSSPALDDATVPLDASLEGFCGSEPPCQPESCSGYCDPWSTTTQCPYHMGLRTCRPHADPCGWVGGLCVPFQLDEGVLGRPCSYQACSAGLVCSGGRMPTCRELCRPGAAPGSVQGCSEDEHCFAHYERRELEPTGLGFCETPCEPGVDDCGPGQWCEPREPGLGTCILL